MSTQRDQPAPDRSHDFSSEVEFLRGSRQQPLSEAEVADFSGWLDRRLPELESRFRSFTTASSLLHSLKQQRRS